MNLFDDMALFLKVAASHSLSQAGREHGLSPAAVSLRMSALERHYGVTLLVKTTRSVRLTPEGERFLASCQRVLREIAELEEALHSGGQTLRGTLRITAPEDLGRQQVAPLISAFVARHPAVTVDLVLTDAPVSITQDGFDAAFRYGNLPDSGLIARRLADNRRVVCAAPGYLARAGRPRKPDDLKTHNCLVQVRGKQRDDKWLFLVEGGETTVTVNGDRTVNDGDTLRHWAIDGHGLVLKPAIDVAADLQAGRLTSVLDAFMPPESGLQILFPDLQHQPPRLRAFIDFCVDWFRRVAL
ncbi:MAG: LysR family transcriptional regulator [Methylobacteriaceae bacterium]|nr:LysR family transcriptional regulator [Methylobacteriaceae bacterium]